MRTGERGAKSRGLGGVFRHGIEDEVELEISVGSGRTDLATGQGRLGRINRKGIGGLVERTVERDIEGQVGVEAA